MKRKTNKSGMKVRVTKNEIELTQAKLDIVTGIVGRAQVSEDILKLIRDRWLTVDKLVKLLQGLKIGIEDVSILMKDGRGRMLWLFRGTDALKLFVDSNLNPSAYGNIPVNPPPEQGVELVLMQPIKNHLISIDCSSAWRGGRSGQEVTGR